MHCHDENPAYTNFCPPASHVVTTWTLRTTSSFGVCENHIHNWDRLHDRGEVTIVPINPSIPFIRESVHDFASRIQREITEELGKDIARDADAWADRLANTPWPSHEWCPRHQHACRVDGTIHNYINDHGQRITCIPQDNGLEKVYVEPSTTFIPDTTLRYQHPVYPRASVEFEGSITLPRYSMIKHPEKILYDGVVYRPTTEQP